MALAPLTETIPIGKVAQVKHCVRYPISGFNAASITQPYGVDYRGGSFYTNLGYRAHNGTDIGCVTGTPLYCCFDKAEITATYTDSAGGNWIEFATLGFTIEGVDGVYRLRAQYGHLLKFSKKVGDWVTDKDIIALSDNTGLSSGPHCHFGLKIDKRTSDGWLVLDKNNGYNGCVDASVFFPDNRAQYFPVDFRYDLHAVTDNKFFGELYKKAITPWLKTKLHRNPTQRELNAFAYGKWDFETVTNDGMFNVWTVYTKDQWKTMSFPPKPLGI